jgi:hypothetical protein
MARPDSLLINGEIHQDVQDGGAWQSEKFSDLSLLTYLRPIGTRAASLESELDSNGG